MTITLDAQAGAGSSPGADATGSATAATGRHGKPGPYVMMRRIVLGGLFSVNLVGAYVLGGMLMTESIDDDLAFTPPQAIEGGLASVDMTVALIEREVNDHAWVANEPGFMPGAWLPNMRYYQQGLVYGLSRFAFELADTLGRSRGATAVDPDLDRAAGLLRFPGDVWVFDFEKTWTPVVTSEEQYLSAARALATYNTRIASGQAVFDPRQDNLYAALARFEADVSSKINVLADHVEQTALGERVSSSSNEVFYNTKGRLYAYAMLLKAMEQDFGQIIEREGLGLVWSRMIQSFENAAAMHPLIVTNSPPGSVFVPNHVTELGFFALRAKTQLRDVMSVLAQ
ncbi:MAG: DUF2333 family protein [Pseudomonadota bacterium]